MESSRRVLSINPREKSNIFSILTFTWTLPLFKKGYSKILQIDDIFQPLKCDRSELLSERLEQHWEKQLAKETGPSLLIALFKTFWKEYGLLSFFCFINDPVARLGQPLLLGQLLLYFRQSPEILYQDALLYAGGIFLLNGLQALTSSQYYVIAYHNAMKIRVAICGLMYRKALRLSQCALGETSPGKVVNLLSNDVSRFDYINLNLNSIWIAPLLALIVAYLLWYEVGFAGLIGIATILTIVPLQMYLGKLTAKFRLQTALRTDQRIRFMDEIISGVQVIKMYAWEKPFANLVASARNYEIKSIRKSSFLRGIHMTFMLFTTRMALFCTMLAIALIRGPHEITANRIFVISAYFSIIAFTMSQQFVRVLADIGETLVGIKRLQNFLELEEKRIDDDKLKNNKTNANSKINDGTYVKTEDEFQQITKTDETLPSNIAISLKSAVAIWEIPNLDKEKSSKSKKPSKRTDETESAILPTLDKIDIDFPKGKLIGVIGPVGSGKSSLLQLLLHELPLKSGTLNINGTTSYAGQEPWVFAASVRQNILFGESFDHDRYNKVVKCCALLSDFEQFENGDRTIIGEKGTLSGGQKARINLARACYRNTDIYLLDDPLSAVDAHVGTHMFDKCIGPNGFLARKNATRILVTHQVHFLNEADWIVILNDGKIAAQGTPADLASVRNDFAQMIGLSEHQELQRQTSVSSTSSNRTSESQTQQQIEKAKIIEEDKGVQMEESSKGKFKGSVSLNYYLAGANWFALAMMIALLVFVQMLASGADYWVSVWTKQEEMRSINQRDRSNIDKLNSNETVHKNKIVQDMSDTSKDSSNIMSTEFCIYIHAAFMASILIIGNIRSFGFFEVCMRASKNLYSRMFNGIISTKMRFFDTNPSGRILNRFSKDIGTVDEVLPKAIFDGIHGNLVLFGAILVTATVNLYFLIPVIVMGALFIFIRMVYLKTSKNIMRIEGIAKSPAFTHFAATLNGLSTVRAYKAENLLKNEFDYHQDTHSACWFMFISTGSAFGFTLDVICWLFIGCMLAFYMFLDKGASGESVGLALSQVLSLTGVLQFGIRQSAQIANLMMSTERVLEYCHLESEKQPDNPLKVPENWPSHGGIEFRNVFYRYFKEADPVLRDLSFVIKPKEKIGIVGRTGAGKSSLIGAIFRLALVDGQILIDDIDTSTIRLQDLRKHVAIIPQDPVLFSGTLRRNLDPFEEHPDDEIWTALEKVELKEIGLGPLGLQSSVLARGANFSVGQRQLLCLARAILRKNRILLMDEATANVDPMTDLLIQRTIREKFSECTVLTIAHRLNTIIDSDRVLVMDVGNAAEFDEPYKLLQSTSGIFYGMVKALGSDDFDRLSLAALEKHKIVSKN